MTSFSVWSTLVGLFVLSSLRIVDSQARHSGMFKMFQFVCGNTLVRCGRQVPTPAETTCQIRNVANILNVVTGTAKQCGALQNEAQKTAKASFLYKNTTLCPNSTPLKPIRVTSYAKYYGDGSEGRYCNQRKGCLCCKGADGFGDPHFVTYDGTPYSYHGQCDLVLAASESFGGGVGLRVHGRTEIVDSWSRISNAAIQIGDDVLEMNNNGDVYYNGFEITSDGQLPEAIGGGLYSVRKDVKTMANIPKIDLVVDVNEGKGNIKISLFKKVIAVHVGTMAHDLNGMLGNRAIEGLVGRNGTILTEWNEMGSHWQVRDTEPMLFHDARAPQYPAQCILPVTDSRRKLRGVAEQYHRRATELCQGITDPTKQQFCVEDVLLTGDVDIAQMYHEDYAAAY
jgi:hypothetical protein